MFRSDRASTILASVFVASLTVQACSSTNTTVQVPVDGGASGGASAGGSAGDGAGGSGGAAMGGSGGVGGGFAGGAGAPTGGASSGGAEAGGAGGSSGDGGQGAMDASSGSGGSGAAAGAAGSGGTAATGAGGAAGSAGGTGSGGRGGTGGGTGGVTATVVCPPPPGNACTPADGERCCWSPTGQTGSCLVAAQSCPEIPITCDEQADCSTGQVCCFTSGTTISSKVDCATNCVSNLMIGIEKIPLCDSTLPDPCPFSTDVCRQHAQLPSGYFTCQRPVM